MARFTAEHQFKCSAETVFNVLADVEAHKHFIPFCKKSTITSKSESRQNETEFSVDYHILNQKYGINLSQELNIVIDSKNYKIYAITIDEASKKQKSSSVTQIVALPHGGSNLLYDVSYQTSGLMALITPKRTLSNIVFKKVNEALETRIRKIQQHPGHVKKTTMLDRKAAAASDARETLLSRLPKNSVGAELGVHMGVFADQILQLVKPGKLHLVDPWQVLQGADYSQSWYAAKDQDYMDELHDLVCQRFHAAIESKTVEVHRCASWDFLHSIDNNTLDWVYIDADHSYASVVRDLKESFLKVKVGGLIAGDDYEISGWWKDNVVRAVDEFIAAYPVELTLDIDGQFMITKLADAASCQA